MIQPWEKKIFVIIATIISLPALSKTTLTNLSNENTANFAGFYAGAGISGNFSSFKTTSTTTLLSPSTAFFSNSQNSAHQSSETLLGTVYAGYLFLIQRFYIGPEIYINFGKPNFKTLQTANATLPTEALTNQTDGHLSTTEAGIDFRFGTTVTPTTLLYGLIGAAFNQLSVNSTATISRPAILLFTTTNGSLNSSMTGLRLGAGLEQKVSTKLSVRVNYVYTTYPTKTVSSMTSPSASSPFFQLGPIANTTSIKTHNHAIFASVVYQLTDILGRK